MTRQLGMTGLGWRLGAALLIALGTIITMPLTAGELPDGPTLIQKHAEASGSEALAKVENMALVFDFWMPSAGVQAPGEEYYVLPDKHFLELDLGSSGVANYEAGFSEDVAWVIHPMSGMRILEDEEKQQSLRQAHPDAFKDWQRFYSKAETVGEEILGDKTCYKVVLTAEERPALTSYFDKESGLLVQEERSNPGGSSVTTKFGDYREVAGFLWPHKVEQQGMDSFTIEYTSVEANVAEIPEGVFEAPKPAPATP